MPRRTWGVLGSLALATGVLVAPNAVYADLIGPTTHVVQSGETLSQIAVEAGIDSSTLASLNGLDDPNLLVAGQSLKLPGAAAAAALSVVAPPSSKTYTVTDGDTLWSIAQQFNTTTNALVQLNSLDDADHLRLGAALTVPTAAGQAPSPHAASQPAALAAPTPTLTPVAPAAAVNRRTVTVTYTVQPGDTLSRIAKQFDVRPSVIADASGLDDPNRLSTGSVLKVPVPGKEHVVAAGETLRDIAAAEKVDLGSLIDFNQLDDPSLIRVGQVVLLPIPATSVPPAPGPVAATAAAAAPTAAAPAPATPAAPAPGTTAAAEGASGTSASGVTPTATRTPAGGQAAAGAPAQPSGQSAAQPAPKPAAPVVVVSPPKSAPTDGVAGAGLKLLGAPYVWGGSSPIGFDCSGFVWYVARQIGKSVSRGMLGEYNSGSHPAKEELKPGDLVFFQNTFSPGLSHNGIYIGNGQFVHAADEAAGVTISSLNTAYWASHWFGATRLP